MSLSDKQNNSTSGKPHISQANSAFRSNRSPLTPKLAGFNSHLPRKLAHFDSPSPNSARTPEASTPNSSTILNANITPRSGQRKARKDGNLSPAATPTPPGHLGPRLANPGTSKGNHTEASPSPHEQTSLNLRVSRAKSMSSETFGYVSNNRPASSCGSSVGTPMFFRADDARSSTSSSYDIEPKPQPPANPYLAPKTFIYADGRTEGPTSSADSSYKQPVPVKKPVLAQPTPIKPPELFVSPRLQETPPSTTQPKQFTGSAAEQHTFSPKLVPAQERAFPQISNFTYRNEQTPESPHRFGHMKSPSCDSTQTVGRKHSFLASPLIRRPTLNQDGTPQPQSANGSVDQSPGISHNPSPSSEDISQHLFPRAPSPSKDDGNELQRMNELAANARRERKVLDLEISNSSLLAINRALEREMRKQNAELRRFRRLSRSGRLSMTPSRRSVSGGLSILSEADGDDTEDYSHSHLSSGYSADELTDTDDEVEPSSSEDDNMSSGGVAEHDEKHRARDETRLLLDLSKHQQLLIDSQKMNQSIKRCLGWTENLISEAKKALEYNVHVSDIEVGGRVLAPDEFDGDYFSNSKGLLSPTMELPCPSDVPSLGQPEASEPPPSIPLRDTSDHPSPTGET
ncbi:uncharacterized protein GIQ15_05934 [Arthroderma uncinatum]|uniref:uncharacterized protein n=1 Tax=Arthroderma uncinatum TaxID=74035 RepID=UPI00144A9BF1|nr:uncharacterized protein GIQ15_05934 [Arthroderma uncinatum]KAF3480587.1 hypothetical protein GIQ15_05934 [Arthroderma uncinatum]